MATQSGPKTFELIERCPGIVDGIHECPAIGVTHCHLSDDALCDCGAYVAQEGVVTEGDEPPFYRVRGFGAEWDITCPNCGVTHTFVPMEA